MRTRLARVTAVIGLALGTSCGDLPVGVLEDYAPSRVGELTLSAEIDRAEFAVGDSAVLTLRLRNDSDSARRFIFGSGCQIVPFIETSGGDVLYPGGGAWACTANITEMTVPAHSSQSRIVTLRGGPPVAGSGGVPLAAGTYRAYARLEASQGHAAMRSESITFRVQ